MKDEINIFDYWRIIVKRTRIIIGLVILCSLAALIVTLQQPHLYRASATIMPMDSSGGGLSAALSAVGLIGGGNVSSGNFEKLEPILQSETLANQVARSLDRPLFFPKLAGETGLPEPAKLKIMSETVRGAVNLTPQGAVYSVTAVWTDPDRAAELANLYVKELGKYLNSRSFNLNFQVIDPATPPEARFSPKIRPNVMLAAVVGGLVGIFLAFVLEFLPVFLKEVRSA